MKKYRARQIYEWLYAHKEYDFNKMSNIGKETIQKLEMIFDIDFIKIKENKQVN